MTKQRFAELLKAANFNHLFVELGWDNQNLAFQLAIKQQSFACRIVAAKAGFKVVLCETSESKLPEYAIRREIENKLRKIHHEHLLIVTNLDKSAQSWLINYKTPGKPQKINEIIYFIHQEPDLLYQKASGMFFDISEEDNITIVDVTRRVSAVAELNAEKVTKAFFPGFKVEHKRFKDFIYGIETELDKAWYTSIMLNRLMFCYFIQKKGFLDSNPNYLRDKLAWVKTKQGKDKFYSFYRNFLLVLFHQGLGSPDHAKLATEYGKIPYLNGGIFDLHELEKTYANKIKIPDEAFERIFRFFDTYNWHIDTKYTATGKDIDPDVIGYIFEKYINDRAAMGAYYTKEDITDYIGKNTIIPYLFDETKRSYKTPFNPEGEIWQKLKDSGSEYIYDSVKHGTDPNDPWEDLPEDIKQGLNPEQENLVDLRRCWNRTAPAGIALPTEIYREVITRRKRYLEVLQKIASGSITNVNDLITYNLNIRQFTLDLLADTEDPELIHQFYKALEKVSILDPTCGSGAFLFAAMNILEDLYEICLERMRHYVEEAQKGKFRYFEETLMKIDSDLHPNQRYYIYKSIILNNLYGVDIMHEAVEIAKLRLFLKLVACVELNPKHPNYGLEPLPDVDFNIRCGNTLIGYANKDELDKHMESDIEAAIKRREIEDKCEKVSMAFEHYKQNQLTFEQDYDAFHQAKIDLNSLLIGLNNDLNRLLHSKTSGIPYPKWLATHQPFHWYAEYYSIINGKGGFDVIIGNPPYIEKEKVFYRPNISITYPCGNTYAWVMEICTRISKNQTKSGLVVPISLVASPRMKPLRQLLFLEPSAIWASNFAIRPQSLFKDVMQRITIIIHHRQEKLNSLHTTEYTRWVSLERPFLFKTISYFGISIDSDIYPKLENQTAANIISKYLASTLPLGTKLINSVSNLYFHDSGESYWTKASLQMPIAKRNSAVVQPSQWFSINIDKSLVDASFLLINSSLCYLNWTIYTDCRHMTQEFLKSLRPIASMNNEDINVKSMLMQDIGYCTTYFEKRPGYISPEIKMNKIKNTIDQIDFLQSQKYGFTPEELDYIINYDIKYRMGSELEGNLNDGDAE